MVNSRLAIPFLQNFEGTLLLVSRFQDCYGLRGLMSFWTAIVQLLRRVRLSVTRGLKHARLDNKKGCAPGFPVLHYLSPRVCPNLFYCPALTYIITGKTIALTIWTFVGKVMSLFLIHCLGLLLLFFQGASVF